MSSIKLVRLEHTNASTYGGKLLVSTATGNAFYISSSAYWIPVEPKQLASKYYVDISTTGGTLWSVDSTSGDFIYPTPYPPKILLDEGYLLYRSFGSNVYIFDSNTNQHSFINAASASSYVNIQPDNLDGVYFTTSGIAQFNNVNILGTLTARKLYFESTTAVEIVTSGSHLEVQGSISITGDPNPQRYSFFDINTDTSNSYFVVTTSGKIGIYQADPQEQFHFSGSAALFECKKVFGKILSNDVFVYDLEYGTYQYYAQSATAPSVVFDINGTETFSVTGISSLSGTSNIQGYQSVTGDIDILGDINVNGLKNFRIDHPDPLKANDHYLVYSALEGPKPSVYLDGELKQNRFTNNIYIKLPSYFKYLVLKDTIRVYLESVGYKKHEYVKNIDIDNDKITIRKNFFKKSHLNYFIMADRKLKNKFEVEIKK